MPGARALVTRSPRLPSVVAAVLGLGLAVVLVWQLPQLLNGPAPSPSAAPSASGSMALASPLEATAEFSAPATTASTPTVTTTPGPTPTNPPVIPVAGASWQPDPVLATAKAEGRVTIDSAGQAVILDVAPPAKAYPAAAALDTRWTGLIQEPPRIGVDDKGTAYTDYNYSLFCGAGTATVILYYWPATHNAVITKSGYFVEPVNLGANRYARTYWKATGAAGYGRGMILYMATAEWPQPDRNQAWWPRPGLMNWDAHPPSTYVQNLVDGINWEASGASRLNYFYVIVPASQLTAEALRDHVHADIGLGKPVVIAARTSDGTHSLPNWSTKPAKSAVNHFVSVVGYDDAAGTYTVMDTCGLTCNDRNMRAGVRTIGQANLFALIQAEPDDDGIMW